MRIARCGVALLCLWPATALAGAWPAPEGGGQVIISNTRKAPTARDLVGSITGENRTEVSVLAEYGLTEDTTLGLVIFAGFDDGSLIDTELQIGGHVRHRFWTGADGDVASVQIGASFPAERWLGEGLGDNRPDTVTEFYARVMYGRGWQLSWANAFLSTGLEVRERGEGLDEEIRLLAKGGIQPHDRVMALFDATWTEPVGDLGQRSFKVTPSVAVSLRPWLGANDKKPELARPPTTMQFGMTWDLIDRDDGVRFSLSIWRPF